MQEKKPFNDVTDHYQKHVGMPTEKTELKKMPKPLRFIGYFILGGAAISVILYLVGIIMTYF